MVEISWSFVFVCRSIYAYIYISTEVSINLDIGIGTDCVGTYVYIMMNDYTRPTAAETVVETGVHSM